MPKHRKPVAPIPVAPALVLGTAFAVLACASPAATAVSDFNPGRAVTVKEIGVSFTHQPVVSKTLHRVPPIIGEHGLTPNALALAHYIAATYPAVQSIGGVRPCDPPFSEHCRGIALDIMVGRNVQLGNEIDADVLAQADRFGVRFTLWRQQEQKPSGAHFWMAPRGGPTQDHYDHLHIGVSAS